MSVQKPSPEIVIVNSILNNARYDSDPIYKKSNDNAKEVLESVELKVAKLGKFIASDKFNDQQRQEAGAARVK